MEPAAVAVVALGTVTASSLGSVARTVASVRLPRSTIGVVVGLALLAIAAKPRMATSAEPPPAHRLVGPVLADPPETEEPPRAVEPTYTVVRGDSLWRIACHILREHTGAEPSGSEIATYWPRIYERNRDVIGDNPNLILIGQIFEIPEV